MKFAEISFQPYYGGGAKGVVARIPCNNGYSLSVVKIFDELNGNSHGADDGLYEAALLRNGEMCYDTHITGFEKKVIGFLTESDVESLIQEVNQL